MRWYSAVLAYRRRSVKGNSRSKNKKKKTQNNPMLLLSVVANFDADLASMFSYGVYD